MKVDLHVHTNVSLDSLISFEQIGEALSRGVLDKIAITDHNQIKGALELKKRYDNRIIVGEEISSIEGHIIGLFIKKLVPGGLSASATVDLIKRQGGLVYLPHIFDKWRHGIGPEVARKLMPRVDILEIFNSRASNPANKESEKFADEFDKPKASSSDSHSSSNLGKAYSEIDDFKDGKGLISSLSGDIKYKKQKANFSLVSPALIKIKRAIFPLKK